MTVPFVSCLTSEITQSPAEPLLPPLQMRTKGQSTPRGGREPLSKVVYWKSCTGKSSINNFNTAATAATVILSALVLICMSTSLLCPSQAQPHSALQTPLPCSFFSAAVGIFFSTAFPPPSPSCSTFWVQPHSRLFREASWSPYPDPSRIRLSLLSAPSHPSKV